MLRFEKCDSMKTAKSSTVVGNEKNRARGCEDVRGWW
jgi:hypothetical protein